MDTLVVTVFALTYVGMAMGRVPGLRIDRTGIALMAVVVLLAAGRIPVHELGVPVDVPTLLLLFALMIVSTQFQAAGLYDLIAAKVAATPGSSGMLLGVVVMAGGLLSAILANDIIVFAMTPVLAQGLFRRGVDARPYLLALAAASNAGSAMTVIGNPQNILIGQLGGLDFWRFLLACGVPGALSLVVVWLVVRRLWRNELAQPPNDAGGPMPAINLWQSTKAVAAVLGLLALFATDLPREVGALVIVGVLLASRRMASREMIGAVDWHLLLLFACLFIVTDRFASTGLAQEAMARLLAQGLAPDGLLVMAPIMLAGSNTIGNVPAVMLLVSLWPNADEGVMYGIALLSTLAGNFLLTGSLANIIVAERAATVGVGLGFMDFARAGIPIALITMALSMLWLWGWGWMAW